MCFIWKEDKWVEQILAGSMSDPEKCQAPILMVGLVCLDIINQCDRYPREDEDVRARNQTWTSGGNASNSSKVLSLIGRQCEFLGTLGGGIETDFALGELRKYGISYQHCVYHSQCRLPSSSVILNTTNGSRTIVHYRNLPELCFEDFVKVDLSQFSWVHFEGRNPDEFSKMIAHVAAWNEQLTSPGKAVTVSIEVEKKRHDLLPLVPLADVLLVSKEFASYHGYSSMEEAVIGLRSKAKDRAVIVCAWGEKGAACSDKEGKIHNCPAFPPSKVVDTLGAGDTFNAGLIHCLSNGKEVAEALNFACRIAGTKCGILGYDGLKGFDLL